MKTKLLFLAAMATFALTSCVNDEFIGDPAASELGASDGSINFGFKLPSLTRADQTGADAATTLGNQFYVYGIKDEATNGAGNVAAGNTVYKNYVVKYAASTANTTTSNTENWEYVGYQLDTDERTYVLANNGAEYQTIKYWDWGAADYTFYAFSAKKSDITNHYMTVTKVQDATSSKFDNGYTVALPGPTTPGDLSTCADLDKLFFAERVNIVRTNGTVRTADNTYGGNVTFRFHNVSTKVRVAMYETVPGYTVTINSFETQNSATPTFDGMTTPVTANFAANFVNNAEGTAGNLTVKYISSGTTINHPTVSFAPTASAANVLNLGAQLKENVVIGTTVTGATYDQSAGAYNTVFPKEDNAQNLKLKLNYTLTSTDGSGEIITVEDATAEIPAEYLKWKPGYCYTYIFKISDNSNGSTGTPGTNPAGLYPITFDASVVIDADGLAEYITTVSEPTITTFAYDATNSKFIHGTYPAGCDIYATFTEGSTVKTPVLGTTGAQHVNIYRVLTSDADKYPITEASVAQALAESPTGTPEISTTDVTNDGTIRFSAAPSVVAAVPGEDHVNQTIDAVKLTGVTSGTYAIEYEASAAWTGTYKKVYKVIIVE